MEFKGENIFALWRLKVIAMYIHNLNDIKTKGKTLK